MEKLFGLWQNIPDRRAPHLFQIQWCLSQMEFLSVQVVLVLSLSFVNLPGVHSPFVLGLDAAHCYSESLECPVCWCFTSDSFVQLRYSWLDLRQLDSGSWLWFTVLMLNCISGSVNGAFTCIPQLSTPCREWHLQRAAAAVGSRRRELVQEVPSDVGNDFVLSHQAYCYHGQTLLASDKCGEAIRSLQESEKCKYSWVWSTGSGDAMPVLFCCIVLICSPIKILSVAWWKSSTPLNRDNGVGFLLLFVGVFFFGRGCWGFFWLWGFGWFCFVLGFFCLTKDCLS